MARMQKVKAACCQSDRLKLLMKATGKAIEIVMKDHSLAPVDQIVPIDQLPPSTQQPFWPCEQIIRLRYWRAWWHELSGYRGLALPLTSLQRYLLRRKHLLGNL